ncbi:MAG: AraC family transcriptional regulator [Lachnospiraceae bacterium]|nr:AraC family transcriptional regulator [Lachnospiraceae bacterium]
MLFFLFKTDTILLYKLIIYNIMEKTLMILNRKETKNNTNSTTDKQSLMLRMVTSYSIFLLVILILFLYLYQSTFRNVQQQYDFQQESTMVSNVELFEKDLKIMDIYCRQLLQNNTFRKLIDFHDPDDKGFMDMGIALATTLSTDVYPEALLPIEEVYCYLPNTDYILSPNYFISAERYYSWMKRYANPEYTNWLKALSEESNYYQFLPMDNVAPNFSKNYYMYMVNMDDLYYMDANAVVCFVLEKEELASLFTTLSSDNFDTDFIVAVNEDNVPFMSLLSNPDFSVDKIMNLHYTNNFSHNHGSLTIGKYTSQLTGYTYYYSFPAFSSTSSTITKQVLYITCFVIAFLLGISLIIRFSRRNVAPIIELGQELNEAVEAQNHLQEVVDSQRPIICNSYVRQLLTGLIASEEEASYIKEYLNLVGEPLYYNCLYIVAYNNAGDSSENAQQIRSSDDFNHVITNALQNYLGSPLYYFNPADRTYALLLACTKEDEANLIIKTNETIVQLHNYLLDTYGIWLFAGIGRNTDSLTNVWESYQQAVESISYTSKNYFFFPYEFIKKDSNAFYYPPELSTKLIHFITTGNTSQVLELFNLIHQENIEERSLPINLLKFLLSDIRNTLLKARFALPSGISAEVTAQLDEQFNEHATFKLCEDIALTLCKLFAVESEDTNLVTAIEKYIEKNFMDPSMGLNKISDEFQISESYFSHMFKEKTGVNFSTYLENIRMSEAARMIKETDISLNELYISVGYNNANTFRRAFKKIYGVTPSSMRENKADK